MKKAIAYAMLVGLLLPGFSGVSYAAIDNQTAPVSVTVTGNFSLALSGQGALVLGSQGAGTYSNPIGLTINNNHGIVWTISLNAATLSDGTHSFPAANFRYSINGGAGVKVPASGEANIPTSITTIYTAALTEYSVSGFGLGMYIIVQVAPEQAAGAYTTTLNITLTDASV